MLAASFRMVKLLLIEDDAMIRAALARSLRARSHTVVEAASGLEGLRSITDDPPEIVILDLGLPDIDGRDLLRLVRAVSSVPVIVATARDAEAEMVQLLDLGADDYVTKPFSAEQIDARARAVLRRVQDNDAPGAPREMVVVGKLRIDPRTRHAELDGAPLTLSRKEFDTLLFLAEREGTVVSKRELMTAVWQQPYIGADNTIDTHISWLRGKLGETATCPRYLHTVRGVGVKLVAPPD